jgi:hypothetical protein
LQTRRSHGRRRGLPAGLLALALSLALAPAASSAVPEYAVGSRITFSVRSTSSLARKNGVFLIVANRRSVNRHGELKRTDIGTFARMNRKRGGVYKWTTPAFTFDTWFMMVPGTYHWQTFFTDCSVSGCHRLSRIRSFKVV